jgi:cytochrome c553
MNQGSKTSGVAEPRSLLRDLFPRRPLQWFGVAVTLGALAAIGGGVTAVTGAVNLSAVPPHPDGWAHLLHFGMMRSVARHADPPASAEPLDSDAMVMRGAAAYAEVCENCHGAPGFGQSPVALSMRPEPPMLLGAPTMLSDKELFFVVANGVRYTGMPAWPVQNRPDEVWAMVAFLKASAKMDGAAYTRLARGEPQEKASIHLAPTLPLSAPGAANALAPFTASARDRPYMAGDPQSPFTTPATTVFPRVGFSTVPDPANPMAACVACHGADGAGRPGGAFPNLTLQSPQYLYDALKAFASGQRQSGVMWPIAASLSDEEMRALSIQLGAAPAVPTRVTTTDTHGDRERGAEIAAAGLATAGAPGVAAPASVERCSSCHIPGAYLGRIVPRIDGQQAAYLRMQLRAFRAGGRGDTGSYDPMVADGHNLSDNDLASVSSYYAARAPMTKN